MKSESAELVSGLIRQYRRLRLLYLGYLAAAVLALVFFFVDKRVTLALVAASLVYHLVVVRRAGKAYQRAFVHACGQCTLARRLQDARHTEAPTLEEGELRRARLVAANDAKGSVLVREGGSGTYHGRRVRLGDAGFTHSFSMEGKTHHEFVVGTWVTVELGKDTGLDWRLIHERVMMKPSRDAMLRRESGLRRAVGFGGRWASAPAGWRTAPGLPSGRRANPTCPVTPSSPPCAGCPPPPTSPWPSASRETASMSLSPTVSWARRYPAASRRAPPWPRWIFSPSWTEFSRPRTPWYKTSCAKSAPRKRARACGA